MTPRPERRLTSLAPLRTTLVRGFARELADDTKLAETVARWSR